MQFRQIVLDVQMKYYLTQDISTLVMTRVVKSSDLAGKVPIFELVSGNFLTF